ncbi:MAG: ribonuclease Z [Archaeoglobaceae archaeon]
MLLKITFLGTSGTTPSVERNLSAILIQLGKHRVLFDCGEGTQRQMMHAKTGFKLDAVFITHLHTDHFLGVFGLLETLSLNEREEKLTVYSPDAKFLRFMFKAFGYEYLSFPVEVIDLGDGEEVDFDDFKVVSFQTDHIVNSLGYALIEEDRPGKFDRKKAENLGIPPGPLYSQLVNGESVKIGEKLITPDMVVGDSRPGRKVVYTGDTRPCEEVETVETITDPDVLIHDGAFTSELQEWAEETKHSTAREAAEIAHKIGAELLVLTHISARYSKDATPLLEEAKEVFKNTLIAHDYYSLQVQYRD